MYLLVQGLDKRCLKERFVLRCEKLINFHPRFSMQLLTVLFNLGQLECHPLQVKKANLTILLNTRKRKRSFKEWLGEVSFYESGLIKDNIFTFKSLAVKSYEGVFFVYLAALRSYLL